ncbi:MAG: type II toxin-antitoxin system RelE/ParE family toxin [Bacteroidota bacterium]
MRVHWTNKALDQLLGIREQIAERSPRAANRLVERLATRAEQLDLFPRSGRVVPEYEQENVREVIERPYRVIYRVKPEQVDILSVIHSRRSLPPNP